jgi:starch synthase (maltosyl-transferring)
MRPHCPLNGLDARDCAPRPLKSGVITTGTEDLGSADPDEMASRLSKDVAAFCAEMNPKGKEPQLVHWQWPRDVRRQVMVPPGHFLLVAAERGFRATLMGEENSPVLAVEDSFRLDDGMFYALFMPGTTPETHTVPHPCAICF